MFHNKFLIVIFATLLVISCTRKTLDKSPQNTLSDYVTQTFAIQSSSDKQKLLEFTTGEVRKTLDNLDSNEFVRNFIEQKKQFISLKIKEERRLSENRRSITYEISYLNQISNARITIKKLALFEKQGEKWLVSEVKNVKTFIDHQNELSF